MHLIVAVATVIALVQTTPDDREAADRAELTRLEQVWNEAHIRGDADALDDLWADDIVVTVPGMKPMTKTDTIAVWRTGRMKFARYESSDLRIRLNGETAIVTGRVRRTRQVADRTVEDDWRFTKVYVRRALRWRVVSFDASAEQK